MATLKKTYKFAKGTLSKNGYNYILTEVAKDDCHDYNLTDILDAMIGIEGISINIGADDEVPSMDE